MIEEKKESFCCQETTNKTLSYYAVYVILTVVCVFSIGLLGMSFEKDILHGKYTNTLYEKECDYILPDGYYIVYDGEYYAVRQKSSLGTEFDKVFIDEAIGSGMYWSSLHRPSIFTDSCKLKKAFHQHIDKSPEFKFLIK